MEWWQKIIQGHEQAKADKTARYRIELDQQWAKERRQEEEEKRVKRARAKKVSILLLDQQESLVCYRK